jgi:peptide deformylase
MAKANPRPITLYGEPVLHRSAAAVTEFDAALADLIDAMFATMYAASGVGLAANQIGVPLQVFVYACTDERGRTAVGHLVNPRLELPPAPRELQTGLEGCLSVPGPHVDVSRPARAVAYGVDRKGKPLRIDGSGLLARCLQHEFDHLQGTVFVDRLAAKQRKAVLAAAGISGHSARNPSRQLG